MRIVRPVIGWVSLILFYFVLGGMDQELIEIVTGSQICVVLLGLFAWGGVPWHKKF